ncbi:MAG: hypothetical protein JSR33_03610 [Proteobacteria bacterium]|nr:hypothetical protein [Pseudomonadota bacterium]
MKNLFLLSLVLRISAPETFYQSQTNEPSVTICPFDGGEIPEDFSPTFFNNQQPIESGESFVDAVLRNALGKNSHMIKKAERFQILVKMLEKAQLTVTNSLDGMSYLVKMVSPYNSLKNLCFIKPPRDSTDEKVTAVHWNLAPGPR